MQSWSPDCRMGSPGASGKDPSRQRVRLVQSRKARLQGGYAWWALCQGGWGGMSGPFGSRRQLQGWDPSTQDRGS